MSFPDFFSARQPSCGKVMFSLACVCSQGSVCLVPGPFGGMPSPRSLLSGGYAWFQAHFWGWVYLVPGPLQAVAVPGPRSLLGWICQVHLWKVYPLWGTPPVRYIPWKVNPQKVRPLEGTPPPLRRYTKQKVCTLVLTSSGGHRSRRYASYWNSLLFWIISVRDSNKRLSCEG